MISDAQLRSLLLDCLKLWEVEGKVSVDDTGLAIATPLGVFSVSRAGEGLRPLRWFYQTPERAAAQRPPRAAPSVVALLSALRNVMAGSGGDRLRVGGG
ncbi:MAG TPA: hypothetical protein DDZ81_07110 [Acetobacteraceae bacterium]|nr:hypothetical protein [Acetobacteraceae bacterium]